MRHCDAVTLYCKVVCHFCSDGSKGHCIIIAAKMLVCSGETSRINLAAVHKSDRILLIISHFFTVCFLLNICPPECCTLASCHHDQNCSQHYCCDYSFHVLPHLFLCVSVPSPVHQNCNPFAKNC